MIVHLSGPQAGLNLSYMRFPKKIHAESRLANATTYGLGILPSQKSFVKQQLGAFGFTL